MDAQEFLARVVAPGAYYVLAYKPPGATGLRQRFFPQTELAEAVAWVRETAKTADVYHAVASFKTKKNRRQDNAEALQCFWYDADIKREGDGKTPERVWTDLLELGRWLKSVENDLPLPNLWVSSGYGVHLYWVLDTPIPAALWMEHAKAFRSLLGTLGARGDIAISANSACVLRPPETFNYKVPGSPAPVHNITPKRLVHNSKPHFVTEDFLARLTPRVSPLGPKPNRLVNTGSLAAAKANLSKPPPSDFKLVASRCLQVQKSLAEEGEHDRYLLWHAMINLAYFCDDPQAAHDLGRKGINYSEEDTDKKFDMTAREHADTRKFGAPLCDTFDMHRPGVCEHCEFRGKINSPYKLGYVENIADLDMPKGYRQSRVPQLIEYFTGDKDEDLWELLVIGNVSNPQLYRHSDTEFELLFDYELSGEVLHVRVLDGEIISVADRARIQWAKKGITIRAATAAKFSGLIVAWITKLKEAKLWLDAPPSFGWVKDKQNEYQGVAIAGTYYRTDGTEGLAQQGDQTIHNNYQPTGDIKLWRKACEYVIADRPELHTLVGASFGAPLMQLIGESGILSVWSQQSGVRKTSTFRVAAAVWCHPRKGMPALKDTPLSVQQSLAETKIMPSFWDEVHAGNKEQKAAVVDMLFSITQGRGRGRLNQKIEQREVGHWDMLLIPSGNKPIAEIVEEVRGDYTDAGAVRVFEYDIKRVDSKADPEAMSIVQLAEQNYGHAGREYIRWVVQNIDTVQKLIKTIRANLHKDIDLKEEERFHVATVVGVVAGAWIANKIGLVMLDWKGVYEFLKSKMNDIRDKREEDTSSDPVKLLQDEFDLFVSEHARDLLVTQNFVKVGRKGNRPMDDRVTVVKPLNHPSTQALIHIGLDERELRFDHKALKRWCDRNGKSHTSILKRMSELWMLSKKTRGRLASSTDYATGAQIYYYKLMLDRPELDHHLSWGTPAPAGNVVPFPAAE